MLFRSRERMLTPASSDDQNVAAHVDEPYRHMPTRAGRRLLVSLRVLAAAGVAVIPRVPCTAFRRPVIASGHCHRRRRLCRRGWLNRDARWLGGCGAGGTCRGLPTCDCRRCAASPRRCPPVGVSGRLRRRNRDRVRRCCGWWRRRHWCRRGRDRSEDRRRCGADLRRRGVPEQDCVGRNRHDDERGDDDRHTDQLYACLGPHASNDVCRPVVLRGSYKILISRRPHHDHRCRLRHPCLCHSHRLSRRYRRPCRHSSRCVTEPVWVSQ